LAGHEATLYLWPCNCKSGARPKFQRNPMVRRHVWKVAVWANRHASIGRNLAD